MGIYKYDLIARGWKEHFLTLAFGEEIMWTDVQKHTQERARSFRGCRIDGRQDGQKTGTMMEKYLGEKDRSEKRKGNLQHLSDSGKAFLYRSGVCSYSGLNVNNSMTGTNQV